MLRFNPRPLLRLPATRLYSVKLGEVTPGPPRLPQEEQEEFERLQKIATSQAAIDEFNSNLQNKETIGVTSPAAFKTIPEFEGDTNPVTGEVGGPKQDPLRFNDWSFNGRVTDF